MSSPIKKYATPMEQVGILTQRGLSIDNPSEALSLLFTTGYFNLINAYQDPFLDKNFTDERFLKSATFSNIYRLYQFDLAQRRVIQSALEKMEIHLRQISARAFIEKYGDDPQAQFNERNYSNLSKPDKFFRNLSFPAYNTVDQPFKHYLEKYAGVPLWVCMTQWDFGTLRIFILNQHRDVKEKIVDEFIGKSVPQGTSYEQKIEFFSGLLTLANRFRNRASHGKRLYNYKPVTYNKSLDDYLPVVHYSEFFHREFLGITKNQYNNGLGRGDIFTLIQMCHFVSNGDFPVELNNDTIDNIYTFLHDVPDLDYHIFSTMGYTTDAMVIGVKTNIERNTLFNASSKSDNLNIFSYYNFERKDDTIHVVPDADLPSRVMNNRFK